MEIHFNIAVSPTVIPGENRVLIQANSYRPVTLGSGYVMFEDIIWTGNPIEYAHAQVYLLSILAKISHAIANDVEEAGYTSIEDLMLKLSEHK